MSGLLINAMSLILSAWVLLLFVFAGCGLLLQRSFGLRLKNAENLLTSFWIGWAFTIFFLQLWHLFFPVDWRALVLLSAAGMLGLSGNGKDLWYLLRKNFSRNRVFCLTLLLTILWLANRAILPPSNYDSGLYHLNAVRWNATFPIVPGLGNLHGRLAFNCSYFLYPAVLHAETGPWAGKAHNLVNGPLLFAMLAQIYLSGFKLLRKTSRLRYYHIFNLLLLVPIIRQVMGHNISSPSPDLPIFLLGIIISARLLALFENPEPGSGERKYTLFFIATLTVLGITIRLNFIALGITALLLVLIERFARKDIRGTVFGRKTIVWSAAVLAIGIIPWMIRGVILSGYAAYPSTFAPFPVEWRLPYASVVNMTNWIYSWAREPAVHWSRVLNNRDWFIPCVMRILFFALPPLLLALPCAILLIFRGSVGKRFPDPPRRLWLFLLPSVVSLIFVLYMVPDPRFTGADFWVVGIGIVTLSVPRINSLKKAKRLVIIFMSIILLQELFVDGKTYFTVEFLENKNFVGAFRNLHLTGEWIVKPGKNAGFYPVPHSKLTTFKTDSGLLLYVPGEGDQSWDAPLPATAYPHPGLRLRNPENMRYGFTIEPRDENDPSVGMHTEYLEKHPLPTK